MLPEEYLPGYLTAFESREQMVPSGRNPGYVDGVFAHVIEQSHAYFLTCQNVTPHLQIAYEV